MTRPWDKVKITMEKHLLIVHSQWTGMKSRLVQGPKWKVDL